MIKGNDLSCIMRKPVFGISTGLPRVREKSGKLKFFQGQGIVREFSKELAIDSKELAIDSRLSIAKVRY